MGHKRQSASSDLFFTLFGDLAGRMKWLLIAMIAGSAVLLSLFLMLPELLTKPDIPTFAGAVIFGIIVFSLMYLFAAFILTVSCSPECERWGLPRWGISILFLGLALGLFLSILGVLGLFIIIAAVFGIFLHRLSHGYMPAPFLPRELADFLPQELGDYTPGTAPAVSPPGPGLPPASSWVAYQSPNISFRYPPGMVPAGSGNQDAADLGNLLYQSPDGILSVSWFRSEKGFGSLEEFNQSLRASVAEISVNRPKDEEIQGEMEGGFQDRHPTVMIPVEYRKLGDANPSMTALVARWYCESTKRYLTVRLITKESLTYNRYFLNQFFQTLSCHG